MQRKFYIRIYIFMLIVFMVGCSDVDDSIESEESEIDTSVYEQTIYNFKSAIVNNDAQALYDLVDLNYEEEVYWTLSEAQDMVDFYSENYLVYKEELNRLEESIQTLKYLGETESFGTNEEVKRIPLAPPEEGLVFLDPNGQLTIKLFRHALYVSGDSLDDYEEITLNYEGTGETFIFDQADIENNRYKNEKNAEVVDMMYFGPGNYNINSKGISQGESRTHTETIELSLHDLHLKKDRRNMEVIHLYLK